MDRPDEARRSASRRHDAELLAELGRREHGRWRRHYAIGAVLGALGVAGGLSGLGLALPIAFALAVALLVGVWVVVDRNDG